MSLSGICAFRFIEFVLLFLFETIRRRLPSTVFDDFLALFVNTDVFNGSKFVVHVSNSSMSFSSEIVFFFYKNREWWKKFNFWFPSSCSITFRIAYHHLDRHHQQTMTQHHSRLVKMCLLIGYMSESNGFVYEIHEIIWFSANIFCIHFQSLVHPIAKIHVQIQINFDLFHFIWFIRILTSKQKGKSSKRTDVTFSWTPSSLQNSMRFLSDFRQISQFITLKWVRKPSVF